MSHVNWMQKCLFDKISIYLASKSDKMNLHFLSVSLLGVWRNLHAYYRVDRKWFFPKFHHRKFRHKISCYKNLKKSQNHILHEVLISKNWNFILDKTIKNDVPVNSNCYSGTTYFFRYMKHICMYIYTYILHPITYINI